MAFKAELPPGVSLPEGHRIDVVDERYKQLEQLATSQRWTQETFSRVLGREAKRVSAEHERASATPAPAPAAPARPAVPENFNRMTTREQFAHALARSPTRQPLP
jgi:hypothetical protein